MVLIKSSGATTAEEVHKNKCAEKSKQVHLIDQKIVQGTATESQQELQQQPPQTQPTAQPASANPK